jgi:PAS domain S-box-containing protein
MAEYLPGETESPLPKRTRRLERLRKLADRILPLPSERGRGSGGRAIGLMGSAIILLIVVFTAVILRENDKVAWSSAQAHIIQITKTVNYQLTTTLTALDRSMRYTGAEIAKTGTPARVTQLGDESQLPTHLLAAFIFIGLDGKVIASAMRDSLAQSELDLSDREYFRFPLANKADGTYVNRPVMSRVSDRRLLPVSRLVRDTRGEPMGVLVALIDIRSLGQIWTDIGLRPDDIVELIGEDGKVWVQWPEDARSSAMTTPDELPSKRLVWSQRLPEWQMTTAGGFDRQAVRLETAPAQLVIAAAALLGSLLVAWFSFLLAERTRLAVRERDAAAQARQAAAEERDVAAALRERLLAALDAVPVEFLEFDREQRLSLINRGARLASPWLDYSKSMGKTFPELLLETAAHFRKDYPNRDWQTWLDRQVDDFAHGGVFETQRANGNWRQVYVGLRPDGSRILIRTDITELRRRAEMLATSERRYIELVASLPDIVISLDHTGRIDYASDAAADVLGRFPDELEGTPLLALVYPDDQARVADLLERLKAGPGPAQSIICEMQRKMDKANPECPTEEVATRFMQLRLKLKDQPGAAPDELVIGGIIRDIHEQQMLAITLGHEMEQLNSVFQSTGAAIIMLDRTGRVVLANQAVLDVQGMTAAAVVGIPYSELKFAGLDSSVADRWRAEADKRRLRPAEFESSLLGVDGEKRIFRFTANPVQDDTGRLRYVVLIGVDDTQRRIAEVRLFDAARLSNLGEMASGIAHEINQPLAVIRLATDSLREELESPEAAGLPEASREIVRQKLDRITGQTERASGIVRDLRTVARKPTDDSRPFDLAEAARVSGDLLREQLKAARIDFDIDLPSPGPMVLGEPSRLQQIVINLVLNARDAILDRFGPTLDGSLGRIDLRVTDDPLYGDAMLIVEDNGPGIPPAMLSRLFEPFFTTKPAGRGTGLGLSISYDIVRRMGGEITAENRSVGGACFRVVLPSIDTVAKGGAGDSNSSSNKVADV